MLSSFVLLTACGNPVATDSGTPAASKQAVGCPQSAGPGGPTLTSIFFGDSSHGIVVGSDAMFAQTGDGGSRWDIVLPPPAVHQISGVAMAKTSHVWVFGDAGLYGVVPGGAPWTLAKTGLVAPVTAVALNGSVMVAIVDAVGGIAATLDNGVSWKVASVDSGLPPLHSITTPDGTHVFAVGDGGTIVASADRGAHWALQASGTTQNLRGVAFTSATTGFAVGDTTTLLTTVDGGATWKPVDLRPTTSGSLSAIAFGDSLHGAIVGQGGTVVFTSDGGAHWKPSLVTDGVWLDAVTFQTPMHGWAVGTQTGMYETKDGGATWPRRNFCRA